MGGGDKSNRGHWLRLPLLVIGVGLILNAAVHWFTRDQSGFPFDAKAFAQSTGTPQLLGARGLYFSPAQLGPTTFGCYLMDVDSQTISVYKIDPDRSRFRLIAARSFNSDRNLTDLNNESPTPKETANLVRAERQREAIEAPTTPPAATGDVK
jgi:hypothetical protein